MKHDVTKLRERIEQKYRAALAALDTVSEYLGDDDDAADAVIPLSKATKSLSNRDRVFAALGSKWMTVDQIADGAGLPAATVRGVVYAPSLKKKFNKRKKGKTVRFRLAAESNTAAEGTRLAVLG